MPSEIQVLYALCLIGEGGRKFLAEKLVNEIVALAPDAGPGSDVDPIDTDCFTNPSWQLFHRAMTEPLRKTAAFAFVADLVKKVGKEREWADRLGPMFDAYLSELDECGGIDLALEDFAELPAAAVLRRNRIQKVVVATFGFRLVAIESSGTCTKGLVSLVEQTGELIRRGWRVAKDGSIPPALVEVRADSKGLSFFF